MRMIDGRDGARLAVEAFAETARARLDGDQPVEARISRLPDLAHTAGANDGQDLVRAKPRARRQHHGSV
ncbi:MAG TPA: hypothetical protein VLD67_20170 [Vicinamibacterales bacterium]|nr:hypothetical protein [Vicinamibacterales bacterium]